MKTITVNQCHNMWVYKKCHKKGTQKLKYNFQAYEKTHRTVAARHQRRDNFSTEQL
jgi:hypothetical protein